MPLKALFLVISVLIRNLNFMLSFITLRPGQQFFSHVETDSFLMKYYIMKCYMTAAICGYLSLIWVFLVCKNIAEAVSYPLRAHWTDEFCFITSGPVRTVT